MNVIKAKFLTRRVIGFRKFDSEQYYQIYSGFKRYNLTIEQVKTYARKDISSNRMNYCKHALARGFSWEELNEWLNLNLNGYVFRYAIEGRRMGIPKEKVQEYATPTINAVESCKLYLDFIKEYCCK